jgi:sodium/potassium-transporting ATPase subunit alpha
MQIGNLLSTRTRRLSIFQQDPFFRKATRNLFIIPAVAVSVGLATLFSYIPGIQRVFSTRGVVCRSTITFDAR